MIVAAQPPLDVADQVAACTLGYLDFRFPNDGWRTRRPKLAEWYSRVVQGHRGAPLDAGDQAADELSDFLSLRHERARIMA